MASPRPTRARHEMRGRRRSMRRGQERTTSTSWSSWPGWRERRREICLRRWEGWRCMAPMGSSLQPTGSYSLEETAAYRQLQPTLGKQPGVFTLTSFTPSYPTHPEIFATAGLLVSLVVPFPPKKQNFIYHRLAWSNSVCEKHNTK